MFATTKRRGTGPESGHELEVYTANAGDSESSPGALSHISGSHSVSIVGVEPPATVHIVGLPYIRSLRDGLNRVCSELLSDDDPIPAAPQKAADIVTPEGRFAADPSGLYHYAWEQPQGCMEYALKDALAGQPSGPAWFWWLDTAAPMYKDDTMDTLYSRWSAWRLAHQSGTLNGRMMELRSVTGNL